MLELVLTLTFDVDIDDVDEVDDVDDFDDV